MLKIAICDDDPLFIKRLKEYIQLVVENKEQCRFYEFCNGREFISALNKYIEIDILFLDIDMPILNGTKTATLFRQKASATTLVFCSGVHLPTPKTFKVNPYRYLLKQYSTEEMLVELGEIFDYLLKKIERPFLWASQGREEFRIYLDDIVYITKHRMGSQIYLMEKDATGKMKNVIIKEKIDSIYEKVKLYGFAYAHASYIVNVAYVMSKTKGEVVLSNQTILGVSRAKEKELDQKLIEYLGSKY